MDPEHASAPWLDPPLASLADSRRRHALVLAGDRSGTTTIDDIARSIARTEHDRRPEESTAPSVRSVVLALYHVHLPKLSAADLVTYDDASETVTRTARGRRFERVVETALETHPGVPE